ncbi:Ankyrin repeat family protein isoform 1 [Hibiscus syriacus]|uniref:Ankyrin repeat family protein isoform 1 n=1 Tax=Hibiscus syriacus TaxID=106335 RepID=A0A6A2WPV7_HIBSY|nr:zinc finger protein ZAT5-like [Hibiscus syriacus]KAE8657735.1 Ankyrin repeat family protein isoform 1 [Hibiscus syriacus]
MMMEGEGEGEGEVVCKDPLQIIKGKRSKRPRPPSPPLPLQVASTTTTTTFTEGDGGAVVSPTFVDLAEGNSTEREQEEDMANCLLLLSQGQTRKPPHEPPSSAAPGLFVHQCKTCNLCFPSFQALGGHRASHKKPKVDDHHEDNHNNHKELKFGKDGDYCDELKDMNTALSLQITSKASVSCNKSRVHECSICAAEFSSGQALGGHMRRHRTLSNVPTTTNLITVGTTEQPDKPRCVLKLDLNLPAPEDDHHKEPKVLSFASKGKLLVFSSSSLVDCHY